MKGKKKWIVIAVIVLLAIFGAMGGKNSDKAPKDNADVPQIEAAEIEEQAEEEQAAEDEKTDGPAETAEPEEEQAEDESKDESDSQKETPPVTSKQKAQQNHAFAEQRIQIKKQQDFIRNIGKLIGYDKDASLEEIQEKVAEALLEKQSKEQNVPVDLLKRIEQAESLLQENDRIKLEKKVTDDFTDLIDNYNLSEDEVSAFTKYLIDNGKNPMLDSKVDIEAEFLKAHHKELVDRAVKEAVAKEQSRKKKVEEKASSTAPHKPIDKDKPSITSVKDLDDIFAQTDL